MKHLFTIMAIAVTASAVSGCAKTIVLQDPQGTKAVCKQRSTEVLAAMGFAQGAEACAEFYESRGFRRVR